MPSDRELRDGLGEGGVGRGKGKGGSVHAHASRITDLRTGWPGTPLTPEVNVRQDRRDRPGEENHELYPTGGL